MEISGTRLALSRGGTTVTGSAHLTARQGSFEDAEHVHHGDPIRRLVQVVTTAAPVFHFDEASLVQLGHELLRV